MDRREDEYELEYAVFKDEFSRGYEMGFTSGFRAGFDSSEEYERGWKDAKEESTKTSQGWYEKCQSLKGDVRAIRKDLERALHTKKVLQDQIVEVQNQYDKVLVENQRLKAYRESILGALKVLRGA